MAKTRRKLYSGFILVRMDEDDGSRDDTQSLYQYATKSDLNDLEKLLGENGLTTVDRSPRLIRSQKPQQIREFEKRRRDSRPPSLTRYWRLDVRDFAKGVNALLARLQATKGVEHAYLELSVTLGTESPSDLEDDGTEGTPIAATEEPDGLAEVQNTEQEELQESNYLSSQGYLEEKVGINAGPDPTQTRGNNVGFADVEMGWIWEPGQQIYHQEYAANQPELIWGDNRKVWMHHGAAVLGIVLGAHDNKGINGIAPNAGPVFLSSSWSAAASMSTNVADAIVAAVGRLKPGDVLLIELQRDFLPVEIDEADLSAIELAIDNRITVIEIAGNGHVDLDCITDNGGNHVLSRKHNDSGAIMVGACISSPPHRRHGVSNWGSRVDCFAWGNNVVTCGYGDLDQGGGYTTLSYTQGFSHTSSAGAIIAGAAILLQGIARTMTTEWGDYFLPSEMRDFLADPNNGIVQGEDQTKNIGVMPDLQRIISNPPFSVGAAGQQQQQQQP